MSVPGGSSIGRSRDLQQSGGCSYSGRARVSGLLKIFGIGESREAQESQANQHRGRPSLTRGELARAARTASSLPGLPTC